MITIYGASDDLIEIDGDIRDEFEFYPDDAKDARVIAISDGTLLRVNYDDDGIWRIHRIIAGTAEFIKVDGDIENDTPDKVTLNSDIKWVVMGEYYALKPKAKGKPYKAPFGMDEE